MIPFSFRCAISGDYFVHHFLSLVLFTSLVSGLFFMGGFRLRWPYIIFKGCSGGCWYSPRLLVSFVLTINEMGFKFAINSIDWRFKMRFLKHVDWWSVS